MHIGTRIKKLMKEQQVSTRRMADYCGVTPGAVSNWFSSGTISKENAVKAASLLGVDSSILISGDDAPTQPNEARPLSALALQLAEAFDDITHHQAKTVDLVRAVNAINKAFGLPVDAPTPAPPQAVKLGRQRT